MNAASDEAPSADRQFASIADTETRDPGNRLTIRLAFLSVYLLWGSTFVAIRYAAAFISPAFVAGLRYLIAGAALLIWRLVGGYSARIAQGEANRILLTGFLLFSVNPVLISYAARELSAGFTALVMASIPLFIAVIDASLSGFRVMPIAGWLATLTGFAGVGLLVHHNIHRAGAAGSSALACGELIIAALAWAIGTVIVQRTSLRTSQMAATAWQMLASGFANVLFGVTFGLSQSHWTKRILFALVYLGVFGSLAGYVSYNYLIRRVRLSAVSTYAYVNPLVAVLLALLLLHEKLRPVEWSGAAIILGSVFVILRTTRTVDNSR